MPNKSTVTGILLDAELTPVSQGKIIATLVGSDIFEGGTRIVTQKVEATTSSAGAWSLDLLVNGEGVHSSTTWTIEGYNQYVVKVFEATNIFIPVLADATLADLEITSSENIRAARDASLSRIIIVDTRDEYDALPSSERRANDIIIVRD